MIRILALITVLCFSSEVFAQKKNDESPERKKIVTQINRKIELTTITEYLRKCDLEIAKCRKSGKPMEAIRYSSFAAAVKIRLDYRWLIADTGLSPEWLKKVHELLAYMSKTQSYIESARFNGKTDTPDYKKAEEYLLIAQQNFSKLIKAPVKVKSSIRRKAEKEKIIWQKTMREKYKINP
jgi:hypothetical protein